MARPSTSWAASWKTSDSVGCACMVSTMSSVVAAYSSASTASATSSDTYGPTMCTPRMRSVLASEMNFTRPAACSMALARPLDMNELTPVLTVNPSALACSSDLPTHAISGAVYTTDGTAL